MLVARLVALSWLIAISITNASGPGLFRAGSKVIVLTDKNYEKARYVQFNFETHF